MLTPSNGDTITTTMSSEHMLQMSFRTARDPVFEAPIDQGGRWRSRSDSTQKHILLYYQNGHPILELLEWTDFKLHLPLLFVFDCKVDDPLPRPPLPRRSRQL